MAIEVPAQLKANCLKTTERRQWLLRLPDTIQSVERQWSLKIEPPFTDASCAWVAPAQLADGTSAVLKLGLPHFEADHELDGLRFWNGNPTVRVLRADEPRGAMLLERCNPGTPLSGVPEPDQDLVIAGLLRRLWRSTSALHHFRHLSGLMECWSQETLAQTGQWPDAPLVRDGLYLFHDLPRTAQTEVLLATDLHAGNVLRSERAPWLAIDPKPFVGDPLTMPLNTCSTASRD
jgi:streptomycin 6-kinase